MVNDGISLNNGIDGRRTTAEKDMEIFTAEKYERRIYREARATRVSHSNMSHFEYEPFGYEPL